MASPNAILPRPAETTKAFPGILGHVNYSVGQGEPVQKLGKLPWHKATQTTIDKTIRPAYQAKIKYPVWFNAGEGHSSKGASLIACKDCNNMPWIKRAQVFAELF